MVRMRRITRSVWQNWVGSARAGVVWRQRVSCIDGIDRGKTDLWHTIGGHPLEDVPLRPLVKTDDHLQLVRLGCTSRRVRRWLSWVQGECASGGLVRLVATCGGVAGCELGGEDEGEV